MAIINQSTKELQVKIVYYGPAMGGKTTNLVDIPYVLQYNKRDLPNVAPVEYMEFLLNNRDLQVPSFTSTAHKCEGVFETLNMITRMLLNKFISQGTPQYA